MSSINFDVLSRLPEGSGLNDPAQQTLNSKIVQIQTSATPSAAVPFAVQSGSHASRTGTPAAAQTNNTLYFETDRKYLYIAQLNQWVFVCGLMTGALSARPADLGSSDAGSQFAAVSGSNYTLYIWSGSAWLTV